MDQKKVEKIRKPILTKDIPKNLLDEYNEISQKSGGWPSGNIRLQEIVNIISDKRFLDPKNVNHVINARSSKKEIAWSPDDIIDPSKFKEGEFFFSTNGSAYAANGTSIVIFSPENKFLRKILGKFNIRAGHKYGSHNFSDIVNRFKTGQELSPKHIHAVEDERVLRGPSDFDQGTLTLFVNNLSQRKRGLRWSDLVDCVVDFKAGKVYFYS